MRIEIDVRPEVARFAVLMEQVLRTKDPIYHGKAAWRHNSNRNLFNWLMGETEELRAVLGTNAERASPTLAAKECADIANLAMMIADNLQSLPGIEG